MDQVNNAATRLRRTFRYPTDQDDGDSDSQPEVIDEEEQERLIEKYAAENASRNDQFRLVLIAIPIIATVPYLISLVARPASAMLSLLGITSLLSSAFLVHRQPSSVTGIAPLDAWARREDYRSVARREVNRLAPRGNPLAGATTDSPLDAYLPYLNLALAAIIAVMGLVAGPRTAEFGFVGMGNWPGLVYVNTLIAKVIMGGVDPERDLSTLKYRYKGA